MFWLTNIKSLGVDIAEGAYNMGCNPFISQTTTRSRAREQVYSSLCEVASVFRNNSATPEAPITPKTAHRDCPGCQHQNLKRQRKMKQFHTPVFIAFLMSTYSVSPWLINRASDGRIPRSILTCMSKVGIQIDIPF